MIVHPDLAPVSRADGLETQHLSVAGGLRQFGAYVETLAKGAWSSNRHWHRQKMNFYSYWTAPPLYMTTTA